MDQQITKTEDILLGCGDKFCESAFAINWGESFFLGIGNLHVIGEMMGRLGRFLHEIKVKDLVKDIKLLSLLDYMKKVLAFD